MATGIKTISDALIARLVSAVTNLDADKVKTFDGSAKALLASVKAVPFVGIKLTNFTHEAVSADRQVAERVLTFELLLIMEYFGDQSYSLENCYGLIDDVTQALMAETLGIDGLRPIEINGGDKNTALEEDKITAYDYEITITQEIQKV